MGVQTPPIPKLLSRAVHARYRLKEWDHIRFQNYTATSGNLLVGFQVKEINVTPSSNRWSINLCTPMFQKTKLKLPILAYKLLKQRHCQTPTPLPRQCVWIDLNLTSFDNYLGNLMKTLILEQGLGLKRWVKLCLPCPYCYNGKIVSEKWKESNWI